MHAIMDRMASILLSEEQKQELTAFTHSVSDLFNRRARLILAYADGLPTMQAALKAGISRGRARYWKRQFLSKGMDIFYLDGEENLPDNEHPNQVEEPEYGLTDAVDSAFASNHEPPIDEVYPFPGVREKIGLKPEDSLAEAGKKVWSFHFAAMLSHEAGTLKGEDVEELHDMRVATRRLRTAFDIFGGVYDEKEVKRYLKDLKKVGRALGQVRDLDVILENGLEYQQGLGDLERPGLDPLINNWKQTIDKKREKLISHLESQKYEHFKRDFNTFLQTTENEPQDIKNPLEAITKIRDIVPVLVYSRYAAVRAYENILPTASMSQLHALRIEFKKLRYTLEYFKEVLGEGTGKIINEIKRYQDHLGELHDADVTCQLVGDFLRTWEENQIKVAISDRINPESIVNYLAYLHALRYRLLVGFPELWQYFNRPEFRQNLAQSVSAL